MLNRSVLRFLPLLALLVLVLPCRLWSQAVGTIVGTVSDASGAIVSGAKVTATNLGTQVAQSSMTNGSGQFTISNLSVGTYSVTAEAASFSSSKADGVTLDVSQTRSIDFKLVAAGATQTTVVTAAPPLLNVSDASLAGLVSEHQVETIPLNGRTIQNLVMMQPGMAQDSGSMGFLGEQWISNGNRGETEVATLDGSDATDSEMGTVQFYNFNLDAIAEFKVQQANYSAEFGQGGGSITQIVSKSGTNQVHGSGYEFIRNSALDASNYFSNSGVAPYQRNEFGFTAGGPIKRDKIFVFGEYAGLRQLQGEPTGLIVPTASQRTGAVTINGYNYQVPLNSVASTILNKYPLPNIAGAPAGSENFSQQFKAPTNMNQFSVRVDYHISDKDSLMGRASYINNKASETDATAAIEDPSFSAAQQNSPRNYAVTETHIFTPNLINVGILTLNRQTESDIPPTQEYTQSDFEDGSLSNWGPDTFITQYVETYYNPSDKVTWIKGRHNLSLGIEGRYGQDDGFGVSGAGPNGNYQFEPGTALPDAITSTDGGPTIAAGSPSPSGLVSMLEGAPLSFARATPLPGFGPAGGGFTHWGLRVWHLYSYAQDDFRVNPKLTLNLGLRYEYTSVPYEIRNRLGAFEDSGPLAYHFVLNPEPLYSPQKANFAPRVGAAYRLTDKTVLRGGYAIFTNSIPTVYPDQAAVLLPMASLSFLSNPTYSLTPLPVTLPYLTSTSGAVEPPNGNTSDIPGNTPVNLAPLAAIVGNISGDWASTHLKNGYTMTGNFTIEQQLPGDMAAQVTYVTNDSTNLFSTGYPNAYNGAETQYTPFSTVTPGTGEIQLFYNQGLFHYNSFQIQMRKIAPTHGLTYQASYSWSKNLTDSDSIFSSSNQNGGISFNNPNCIRCEYARASFDLSQRFVANFSYELPGHWGFVPERLSNGWQTLGIFSAQTGFPFSILEPYGTIAYGYDSYNGVGARPFFVKPIQKGFSGAKNGNNIVPYFSQDVIQNTSSYFSSPTATNSQGNTEQTAPGNLGRNTATGPGWWNLDFSLVKDTKLTELVNFQFRAEFLNVFNHVDFSTPNGTITNPNFGAISSTISNERYIQFGGRFTF